MTARNSDKIYIPLNLSMRPCWCQCSRSGLRRTNPPAMLLPSLWQSYIQTTLIWMKILSWTCSRRRSESRRSAPWAMLFVLQWFQPYFLMTLKSTYFKCPLLDLTLIRKIVLFIGILKLSLLVLPDMHGLNGTIKRITDGNLLKLGLTTTMVPVSLVRAPLWRNQ